MLKPLIPSIPSKELLIEGRYYQVYEEVKLYISLKRTMLAMNLAYYRKRCYIKTFPNIRDIRKRDKAIHLCVEHILMGFHDYIEKHYVGDRFIKIDSSPKPTVQNMVTHGRGYTVICYTYKRSPENIVKNSTTTRATRLVGRTEEVTQSDIDERIARAEKHQLEALEIFKTYLIAKRKAFREQVDKEIAERDSMLR